jgi:hypothetical protein
VRARHQWLERNEHYNIPPDSHLVPATTSKHNNTFWSHLVPAATHESQPGRLQRLTSKHQSGQTMSTMSTTTNNHHTIRLEQMRGPVINHSTSRG